jgi:hypothetical protein
MTKRDFAVVALGRSLVVERYIETHPAPPARRLWEPGPDRDRTDKPGSRSGSQAPARPEHG